SALVLLDLSAAFDTVNHRILLSILSSMGISGNAHSWFESYLTGRSFNVSWQGQLSVPQRLNTGVPQGLVLPFTPPRWAESSIRMIFHITTMHMIPNCIRLSLLTTPLSRHGSRIVSLIYLHGSPSSAEPGQNGTDGLPSQTG